MEMSDKSMELGKLFKEIIGLLRQKMGRIYEKNGLTATQGMVIGIISKLGKMKINELSEKMGLTDSTVSGIIDRLEKHEFVVRERSTEDKRVVYVSLSPKFGDLHRDFHSMPERGLESLIAKGTPEDIETVTKGLQTMKRLLCDPDCESVVSEPK